MRADVADDAPGRRTSGFDQFERLERLARMVTVPAATTASCTASRARTSPATARSNDGALSSMPNPRRPLLADRTREVAAGEAPPWPAVETAAAGMAGAGGARQGPASGSGELLHDLHPRG
ncbi:hypothetical protein GCM10017688_41070 [Streptomyces ramulosus]